MAQNTLSALPTLQIRFLLTNTHMKIIILLICFQYHGSMASRTVTLQLMAFCKMALQSPNLYSQILEGEVPLRRSYFPGQQ